MPVIVAKDRSTQCFAGTALAKKGVDDYATSFLTAFLLSLGWKRLVLRSDNEPSLLALLRRVAANLPGIEVIPKTSPEGDHAANGLAEVGVREVKAQSRVIRSQLEARLQKRLTEHEPILSWIPRHAANVICRFRVLDDGRTPDQRRCGRRWRRPVVEFGEGVQFRKVGEQAALKGADARTHRGVYVGHHERTGAALFLTPEGVMRGTRIVRMTDEHRWNLEFMATCVGLPWALRPEQRELPQPAMAAADIGFGMAPIVPAVPGASRGPDQQGRRRYVTRKDIEVYGPTDECPACTQIACGAVRVTKPHNDKCRERIGECMGNDPDFAQGERLKRHRVQFEDKDEQPAQPAQPAADVGIEVDVEEDLTNKGKSENTKSGHGSHGTAESLRPSSSSSSGAAPPSSEAARQGQKRQAENAADDSDRLLEVREPDRGQKREAENEAHIDADIVSGAAAGPDLRGDAADAGVLGIAKRALYEYVDKHLRGSPGTKELDETEKRELATLSVELGACDVAEIFSPPRFTAAAGSLGLREGFAVDLSTQRSGGEFWDLSRQEDREELERLQEKEAPELLTGSPPCTDFCRLLHLKLTKEEIEQRQRERGRPFVETSVAAYRRQLDSGKHFLHEHPKHSASWKMDCVKALAADERVYVIDGPMCKWGLTASDDAGFKGFVRKETRWMTSSAEIAAVLRDDGPRCTHRHVHLIGGGRATMAAAYPPKLVVAVLKALRRQMVSDGTVKTDELAFAGPVPDEGDVAEDMPGTYGIDGQWIDPALLKAGRDEEMSYMVARGVYDVVDESECRMHQGRPYSLKWVDRMKADKCRSRLVVREIKKAKKKDEQLGAEEVFSAMPPAEGLKMLISAAMTDGNDVCGHGSHGTAESLEIATWDVSRAHLYGESRRWVYTTLPEGWEQPGKVARLRRSMYGTQDAASIWSDTWAEKLVEEGIRIGTACPALFSGIEGKAFDNLRGMCHGDDFVCVAPRGQLKSFGALLEKHFEVKQTGHIGFAADCGKKLEILNRTLSVDVERDELILEADVKLVTKIVEDLGLVGAKGVDTPRIKRNQEAVEACEASELLKGAAATQFRSNVMRGAYLAQDRVDISEGIKALSRFMATPRAGHLVELKRMGRYLAKNPRCVQTFARQDPCDLHVHVDADWAGDLTSRRSTSGMVLRRGRHLLRHMSTMQTCVALSTAESEFYALTRGASNAMGTQSHYGDLNLKVGITLFSDSSAARSATRRKGLGGKLRHLQTRHLWLQQHLALGHVVLKSVAGTNNPADVLTKALCQRESRRYCEELGQRWLDQSGARM